MKIVLFRHGLAVERSKYLAQGKNDALRPLMPKGREKTLMMAKHLKKWEPDFDLILSSPFVRARQTTLILSKALGVTNIFETKDLVPDSPVVGLVQWLRVHAEDCHAVLVVGHEPYLSTFAGWCLGIKNNNSLELKKSGMLALEVADSGKIAPAEGKLLWHVSPKQFE